MKKKTPPIKKKKLKNVTWVLGDKPCKSFKLQTGCWADLSKK